VLLVTATWLPPGSTSDKWTYEGANGNGKQHPEDEPPWTTKSEETSIIDVSSSSKHKWSCELCGSQFTLQSSYSRHIKYMHSSHRSYVCLLCGANFKRKDNLASHLKHRHMHKNT
jgi:transposase-like protein